MECCNTFNIFWLKKLKNSNNVISIYKKMMKIGKSTFNFHWARDNNLLHVGDKYVHKFP